MAWCDWLAAIWAFVAIFAFMTITGWGADGGAFLGSGDGAKMLLILIVPVWVIARMIDAMVGGPARRRHQSYGRVRYFGDHPRDELTPPEPEKCPWGSIGGTDKPTRNARGQFVRAGD
jgi:hypothetical protein